MPTAILASTLKPQKETYASFAKRNGIPLPKVDAQYQFADCWDYSNQQGQSVRITDYTPNLGNNANRFSSCCYYGIWLMYDDIDYNSRNTNVSNTKFKSSASVCPLIKEYYSIVSNKRGATRNYLF